MEFILTIDTNNAAFDADIDREVAVILHDLADVLAEGTGMGDPVPLFDSNGNRVGCAEWRAVPHEETQE